MATTLNPYLSFRSEAREAMAFYRSVFGGELTMNTFAEFGGAQNPAENDLIMHSQLTAPNGFKLMGSDTPAGMDYHPAGNVTISLSGDDDAELRGYWNRLAEGAEIAQPLEKAPWGDSFGMLKDRYGIAWMVNIAAAQA